MSAGDMIGASVFGWFLLFCGFGMAGMVLLLWETREYCEGRIARFFFTGFACTAAAVPVACFGGALILFAEVVKAVIG